MTVSAALAEASRQLTERLSLSAAEARIEVQALLRRALGSVSRAWLMTHAEQALTAEQAAEFRALIERRLAGEPVAYILGRREFYGLAFAVTPAVLIPRPDTEILVEAALRCIPERQPCRVLDLGTGSGAVAIAIAIQRPRAGVVGVDGSPAALALAARNAAALGAGNLTLMPSDWFSALQGEVFEVIVGNPPYIAVDDPHLVQGDLRFEPREALVSGRDGLDAIRCIVAQVPAHLAAGGWLLLEHGYDQAETVAELLRAQGFAEVGHVADLAGIWRVTLGRRP